MKKILILTIAIFSLISCSSEEGDGTNSSDPIIGTWSAFSINGTELSACLKKSTLIFSENGNLSISSYYVNSNGDCLSENSSGTWTNKGNNIYSVTLENDGPSQSKVTFSDNNNTMTVADENTVYKRK